MSAWNTYGAFAEHSICGRDPRHFLCRVIVVVLTFVLFECDTHNVEDISLGRYLFSSLENLPVEGTHRRVQSTKDARAQLNTGHLSEIQWSDMGRQ